MLINCFLKSYMIIYKLEVKKNIIVKKEIKCILFLIECCF